MLRTNAVGEPIIPPPPGLPTSPWAIWALAAVTSAATEALDLTLIGSQTNRIIVGVAGIVVPLVFVIAEVIWRSTHAKAQVALHTPLPPQ